MTARKGSTAGRTEVKRPTEETAVSRDDTKDAKTAGVRPGVSASGVLLAVALLMACGGGAVPDGPASEADRAAAEYLVLVPALIAHDHDSASGDTALSDVSLDSPSPSMRVEDIAARALASVRALRTPLARGDTARLEWLAAQLDAVAARASAVAGTSLSFDEELRRLYGVQWAPQQTADAEGARNELERRLPGGGALAARLRAFDERFIVPPDRLPAVFERAVAECRTRSRPHLGLPPRERVEVRYVTGRPWSGFSRYVGQGRSVIEVNTQFPLTVDRALDLACHESYPGHHALNVLRDERRAEQGWEELSALPLFSPASFAAEVLATRAAATAFTDDERRDFERDVLFPLAGLPPGDADLHVRIGRLVARLSPAITDAVGRYLRQEQDYVETTWALRERAAMQQPQPTLAFVHQFRGFALAYTWAVHGDLDSGAIAVAGDGRWTAYHAAAATN